MQQDCHKRALYKKKWIHLEPVVQHDRRISKYPSVCPVEKKDPNGNLAIKDLFEKKNSKIKRMFVKHSKYHVNGP